MRPSSPSAIIGQEDPEDSDYVDGWQSDIRGLITASRTSVRELPQTIDAREASREALCKGTTGILLTGFRVLNQSSYRNLGPTRSRAFVTTGAIGFGRYLCVRHSSSYAARFVSCVFASTLQAISHIKPRSSRATAATATVLLLPLEIIFVYFL